MMVIGMAVVIVMTFTFFPAGLMLLSPGVPQVSRAATRAITGFMAHLVSDRSRAVTVFYIVVAVAAIVGVTRLNVENRFIDNFKETTEIYQGMVKIDQELGGTTPLDIILDADPAFFVTDDNPYGESGAGYDDEIADDLGYDEFGEDEYDDEFDDEFVDEFAADEGDLGSTSFWYNTFQLQAVRDVHEWLESLPETGKVLSMATTIDTLQTINDDEKVSTFWLSILYKRCPTRSRAPCSIRTCRRTVTRCASRSACSSRTATCAATSC